MNGTSITDGLNNKEFFEQLELRNFSNDPSLITISSEEYNLMKKTLENNKKIIEILENDVNKLRIENIRLEKSIKNLQETLALRGQVFYINHFELHFNSFKNKESK